MKIKILLSLATILAVGIYTLTNLRAEDAKPAKDSDAVVLKIQITGVTVKDQAKALKFYTEVLGFKKKTDVPAGGYRWLTVVSPAGAHGVEFLLEPNGLPVAAKYQDDLFKLGVPATQFGVEDIDATYEKLVKKGVKFKGKPQQMGPVKTATFDDTCGNWIMLVQGPE